MSSYAVLINVDENGFMLGPVEVDLFDENGNPSPLLNSKYLVKGDEEGGFYTPKWDFEKLMWTEGTPDKALELAKINKIARFTSECNTIIDNGFTWNGFDFMFTKSKDQPLFDMQLTFALKNTEKNTFPWKTKNMGVKIFTRDEFFSICDAAEEHLTTNTQALWQLEEYINGLDTMDKVNALESFETSKSIVL